MRLIDPMSLKMEIWMNNIFEQGKTLEEIIDDVPDADAAPVVHGRWEYCKNLGIAVCTECGFERELDANFGRAISCPNCGAKMFN